MDNFVQMHVQTVCQQKKKVDGAHSLGGIYIECNTMRWTRWTNYMELFDFSMGIMKNMRQFSFVSRFTIESGLSIVRYTSFFLLVLCIFPAECLSLHITFCAHFFPMGNFRWQLRFFSFHFFTHEFYLLHSYDLIKANTHRERGMRWGGNA